MKYFRKISGARVYLSPINTADVEIYTKWLNDPDVAKNLGHYPQMMSLENEKKALERLTGEGHNYAIVTNDDVLIGGVGFDDIDHLSRRATVGIFIGEAAYRGKGYGTEALRLISRYGFKTLNLHNIMLTVDSDNEQAIACYKKVGFREFGRRREAKFKDSRYIDSVFMDILDSEFS